MEADTALSGQAGEGMQPDAKPSSQHVNGLAELEVELADMRDRWMRAEAEIANVGTRAKRDLDDAKRYAVQTFATDVVEAAENLRRGLDSIPPASDSEPEIVRRLRDGFSGVERAFITLLKRNGIARIEPTGSTFDPALHQAMSEAPADGHDPGSVLRTLSAGWTLNGRLLRPAMVVVAKASAADSPAAHTSKT
jgi:molecular chaperone GrpE